jgi:hypothetical protein
MVVVVAPLPRRLEGEASAYGRPTSSPATVPALVQSNSVLAMLNGQ